MSTSQTPSTEALEAKLAALVEEAREAGLLEPLHAALLRALAPLLSRVLPTLEIREDGDPALLSTDPAVGEEFYADPLRVLGEAPGLRLLGLSLAGLALASRPAFRY